MLASPECADSMPAFLEDSYSHTSNQEHEQEKTAFKLFRVIAWCETKTCSFFAAWLTSFGMREHSLDF